MDKALQDKIKYISFQMFRDWSANAQIQFPDYDFTIIDETILVNNLSDSIKAAVNALREKEESLERMISGFDVGFVQGFIQSNLNGHWYHEYIRKRSNDYKTLMTLKALISYLDIEDVALIKINEIYERMFFRGCEF